MDWRTGTRQAIDEFSQNKLRTLLTLLGMIFGVGAVISMLAIGEGAERESLKLIDSLGLRNVIVEATPQQETKLKEIREDSLGLNMRDLEVAKETLPQIVDSSGVKKINTFSIFSDGGRSDAEVLGVSPSHFAIGNLSTADGRAFDVGDDRLTAPIAVVGTQVAQDLFGSETAVGRRIKVNHVWLEVVGVLEAQMLEATEFEGVPLSSPQNKIFIPLNTALKRFRYKPMENELDAMHLQLNDSASISSVAATLTRLLETRHGGIADFQLIVPEALLRQHRQTQQIFDIVMAAIAGISLLVGGIGIMNIMLATVLERTREIGIRRAIGAKRADIRRQFLIESFTISLFGGILGIIVGFGLAAAISWYSEWPMAWSAKAPFAAVTVCTLVGLGFGLYPAIRAARLDPIEALSRNV